MGHILSQLIDAQAEQLSADPAVKRSRFWYNTTSHLFKIVLNATIRVVAMEPTYSTVTAAGAYAPTVAAGSRWINFDATLGAQSLTLPADPTDGLTFDVTKSDVSANTVTITGTVSGEVNPVIDYQYTHRAVVAVGGAWFWKV